MKRKKEWVIVPHCLRECVVCSITCLTSLKSYHEFWVELWCVFVLEPLSLSLVCVCVCVCFSKKKKKKRVIISHCLRECVVCSITCPPSLKSYYGFWVELWCAFVLEHFSHFLVWWVIVTHYLRECVVCSVTCPPFLKSYNNFWVKLWYAFVLDPLFLFPVCIFF